MSTVALETARSARDAAALWVDRHIKWVLVAPALILILLLTIFPLGYSIWVSFVQFDFRLGEEHPWVGADNYAEAYNDAVARGSLWHTIVLAVSATTLQLMLGLGLALAMQKSFRGRRWLLALFIFPLFMSPIVVGQIWRMLLDTRSGPVNWLLEQISGSEVSIIWLAQTPWTWFSILIADTWQWTPFMFMILLAGLAAIPEEVYEAANLDGASAWQAFRDVTLPLLVPIIILAVTFRLLDAFKLFDIILVLTQGGPGASSYTASFYLYQEGFRTFNLGLASAGSWLFLVLVALIAYRLVRRLLPQ